METDEKKSIFNQINSNKLRNTEYNSKIRDRLNKAFSKIYEETKIKITYINVSRRTLTSVCMQRKIKDVITCPSLC